VLCHGILFTAKFWHGLYEAYHSLITRAFEFLIVTRLKLAELRGTILQGVDRDCGFNRVLKVCKESEPVLELYLEGLVVNW